MAGLVALDAAPGRPQIPGEGDAMSRPKPARAEHNAGAFLGPDIMVPVPMTTLTDDYRDEPAEPEDSDRVPEPEPKGRVRRLLDRLLRRSSGR